VSIPPGHARVWDAPTRLFHWSLAAAFAGDWLTRDARDLELHVFLGYAIGALVAFRVVWGFAGTRWARFSSFPFSVTGAFAYGRTLLRGRHPHHVGHNPAGSIAIYALLALAALEVLTGVFTLGAEKLQGPLAGAFGYRVGDLAHEAHLWIAYAMLGVVGVHILGVVVGSFADRENLVGAMLTGRKRAPQDAAVAPRGGVALALAVLLGGCALIYFFLPSMTASARSMAAPLAADPAWKGECSDCHLAYHPSLLPSRSWRRMFEEQHRHFGEDLALEDGTRDALQAFALRHAAEALESPVAWKMATTIAPDAAPLRITETAYWKERHARLDTSTWKAIPASDCGACHRDAEAGAFAPGGIARDFTPGGARKARDNR
jgi:cytochrome b